MDQIVNDAAIKTYRDRVKEGRSLLIGIEILLQIAHRLVRDTDGANEQAEKRISEAINKVSRAADLLGRSR